MTHNNDAIAVAAREQDILRRMLTDADSLCRSADPLMSGQYQFLRGRIAALIKINESVTNVGGA